jgi:virulence-associated protein VagC
LDEAKLITMGKSQVVLLPKAYEFICERVEIRRDGERIVLRPIADRPHSARKA